MKKFSKVLISVLLAVAVLASACALTSVLAGAQATTKGVSIAFTGADNDWVSLSGTTIKDSALAVAIYNDGNDDIVVSGIATNGSAITYSGWTTGMSITAGQLAKIGIAGTTAAESVLTVTVTYRVKGNPTSTSETCTAYIFCSAQAYTSTTCAPAISSGLFVYGVDTELTISPVSSATVSYTDSNSRYPVSSLDIYVDGSKYKTWADFNLQFDFYNGTIRDHSFYNTLNLTQTSDTGSLSLGGIGTDPQNKTVSSVYNKDSNPEGFFMQAAVKQTVSTAFAGTIPTEASSKFVMSMVGYGQTAGVVGLMSATTKSLEPSWTINVYNNNKSALRERLIELANLGLNKASYRSGWDNYEAAVKNAYKVLGTVQVTASTVSSALSTLNSTYNNLVRYAVVITKQNYYTGKDNTTPVVIAQTYDMQVVNGAVYNPTVLTNGQYADYPFNRTSVTTDKTIKVDDSTNYTETINQYYWNVDTTALEAAISEQASWKHVDEEGSDMYTTDSWQAYAAAAAAGTKVLNDLTLFQTDIDTATKAITDAKAKLVRLDIDTDWLAEGIEWAGNIIDNNYADDFGYGWDTTSLFGSAYSQSLYANLLTAYNEANEVTSDPQFTKSQADAVCKELWDAIYALRIKDATTKGLYLSGNVRHADVDKYGYFKSLTDNVSNDRGLRVVFEDINDNTTGTYMLKESDFTADSWSALHDAMYGSFAQGNYECAQTENSYTVDDSVGELSVPAYSMINNIWFLASQADYNACRDNLVYYVNNLEYVVTFDDLTAKLDEANGYDLSNYTTETAKRLSDDITYVNAMVEKLADPQLYGDKDAVTQDKIDTATVELTDAISSLVAMPKLASKVAAVTIADGFINGETASKTVAAVKSDFNVLNNDKAVITIYDADGNAVLDTDNVGTGYQIVLSLDGVEYEREQFIIMGDVLGNGRVTDNDFMTTYNYFFTEQGLSGVYLKAADMNKDGIVDLCDAIMIKDMIG